MFLISGLAFRVVAAKNYDSAKGNSDSRITWPEIIGWYEESLGFF